MSPREGLTSTIIAFLVINGIAIPLRLAVRFKKGTVGYDDWAILVAMALFVVFAAFNIAALAYGYGLGMEELMDPASGNDIQRAGAYFTITQIIYCFAQATAKLSVALVLHRLAASRSTRIVILVSVVLLFVWALVFAVILGLQCRPLSAAWGGGEGECIAPGEFARIGYALSSLDIIWSWFYALLPVYMLKGVQMSNQTKVGVIILLGLGVVSGVATVLRLKFLVEIGNLPSSADPRAPGLMLEGTTFTTTEVGLFIFTGAIAALKPLLKWCLPFLTSSGGRSGKTPGGTPGGSGALNGSFPMEPRMGGGSQGGMIRLADDKSNTGSEEDILGQQQPPHRGPYAAEQGRIHKTTQFSVNVDRK